MEDKGALAGEPAAINERSAPTVSVTAADVAPIEGGEVGQASTIEDNPRAAAPNPRYDSGWLAAAAAALMRGNSTVAQAMIEMALEEDPYDPAAWALRMRLLMRQAGKGTALQIEAEEFAADAEAYRAIEAAGEAPRTDYDVDDRLYNYWHTNGGVPVFGCPITPFFAEIDSAGHIVEVQYFERARLEYQPERAGTPFEVVPGKLGTEVRARGVVELQAPEGLEDERVIFTTRGTGMPTPLKFFQFWESNGGPDIFGYPITPLLADSTYAGRPLAVQYFEKARLEYHPEFSGTVYEVQVSKLGAEVFAMRYGA
jgi:hypothetical protein